MTLRDAWGKLDRAQRGKRFKIFASCVITALVVGLVGWYVVEVAANANQEVGSRNVEAVRPDNAPEVGEDEAFDDEMAAAEKAAQAMNDLMGRKADWTSVAVGGLAAMVLAFTVIWLGIGVTSLLLLLAVGVIVAPLWFGGGALSEHAIGSFMQRTGLFLAGVTALAFGFVVLMELLRLSLSGPYRIIGIARNVVSEAVRLKISLVFIVLLLFALAALPQLLDDGTPLRYRVQAFMQYGTAGTFWIIAILTLFLSVGTVAFEQRDRVIWQTMTKPVAAWEYLLGKWVGVIGLSLVLLTVSACGVFLFTEYLRNQPATGEASAFVPSDPGQTMTEDRFVLETQVLSARRTVEPSFPDLDVDRFREAVGVRIAQIMEADPAWQNTPESRREVAINLQGDIAKSFRSVPYGAVSAPYEFRGLDGVRASGKPIVLKFKPNVGSNDPRESYSLRLYISNLGVLEREVPVGQMVSEPITSNCISEEGTVLLRIQNLGMIGDRDGSRSQAVIFPPDGLTVYYEVGSYRPNFLRVIAVLWLKLAFLAMIGIVAATFLNFQVAALVAFAVFLIAESAGYLSASLEYFSTLDDDRNVVFYKAIARAISVPIATMFQFYVEIRPTTNLIDGQVVPTSRVLAAFGTLGTISSVLYGMGVLIFRRRELATYSGH